MAHAQRGEETSEALWWSLFGAGGIVAAMLTPAHVLLQNLLGSAGLPVATVSIGMVGWGRCRPAPRRQHTTAGNRARA